MVKCYRRMTATMHAPTHIKFWKFPTESYTNHKRTLKTIYKNGSRSAMFLKHI